jgi:hypothetical protein
MDENDSTTGHPTGGSSRDFDLSAPDVPARSAPRGHVVTTYVCVPRAVFDRYWSLPWADVIAAAAAASTV